MRRHDNGESTVFCGGRFPEVYSLAANLNRARDIMVAAVFWRAIAADLCLVDTCPIPICRNIIVKFLSKYPKRVIV